MKQILENLNRKIMSLDSHSSRDRIDEAIDECEKLIDKLVQMQAKSEWTEGERWK